jgi:hypothetical protein
MYKTFAEYGQTPYLWPITIFTISIIFITNFNLYNWHQQINQEYIQLEAQRNLLKNRLKTIINSPITHIPALNTVATPPHQFIFSTLPGECSHWLHHFSPLENTSKSQHTVHLTYQGPFLAVMRCLEAHSKEWAFSKLEFSQNDSLEKPTQLWLEGPLSPAISTSASTVLPERVTAFNPDNIPVPSQFPSLFESPLAHTPPSVRPTLSEAPTWQWQGTIDNGSQRWALFSDGKTIHRLSVGDRWGTAGVITRIEMDGAWWRSPQGELHQAGIH